MLLQISRLRETFTTTWNITHEGLFICVDSEVVEEVASLSELFSAILAFHDSSHSFCVWVKIFQNFIMLSIWNVS
jgi:hypothetical protein